MRKFNTKSKFIYLVSLFACFVMAIFFFTLYLLTSVFTLFCSIIELIYESANKKSNKKNKVYDSFQYEEEDLEEDDYYYEDDE